MNELYRTYEVLVEESVHPKHSKREKTTKPCLWELDNGEKDAALRDTHMIFQDAVCYYTLCLAGLAENEKHEDGVMAGQPLNPLWGYLTGAMKERTEAVIRRLATNYQRLAGIKTTEQFFERAYSWPEKPDALKVLLPTAYMLLESYGVKYSEQNDKPTNVPKECKPIKNFRNDHFGRLHDPVSGKADTSRDKAVDNYFANEKAKLAPDASVMDEQTLSESLDLSFCFKSPKGEIAGLPALYDYLAAFGIRNPKKTPSTIGKLQPSAKESASDQKRFAGYYKFIGETKDRLLQEYGEYPSVEKGASKEEKKAARAKQKAWIKNAKAKSLEFRWKSHAGKKPNKRLWYCLRYKFCAHAAVRLALYEEVKKLEPQTINTAKTLDVFNQWRQLIGNGKAPILSFTSLLGGNCIDPEFDKAAFAAAAEDLFKYKIRTRDREEKVRKVLEIVKAYEAKSEKPLEAEDSPTGKKVTIHGMADDPRWKAKGEDKAGIESLLKDLRDDKKLDSYGLREGTIGGWPEVRKALLQVHEAAAKEQWEQKKLTKQLEDEVDKEMEGNRQGFGSADFFHALCAPAYHHLWLNGSQYERNGIKDFIPHYVRYAEWREELIELLIDQDGNEIEQANDSTTVELEKLAKKPISYTWPGLLNRHKKPSYRYYDFTAPLKTNLQLKCLFRRVAGESGSIPTYKKQTGDDATFTLAARRLKRDKIVKGDGSVDALWCPPLILEGTANPTTAEKPRAGKYDDPKRKLWPRKDIEASFSLMAMPLPDDKWNEVAGVPPSVEKHPVHLTVSIPIEGDELEKLHSEGVHFVGGSLKGVDENDDKRKFFRWPIDIETDKASAKESAERAAKAGSKSKKQSRKPDVKPEELWCHFKDGFRVKKGRYSKAEETKTVPDFHILSVDLGNRFAAGFSRLHIHADASGVGRIISAENTVIKAEVTRTGTLRLQGEDAKIWQRAMGTDNRCLKDTHDNYIYEFKNEPYGNDGRGRFPDAAEYEAFKTLARRLVEEKALSLEGTDKMTYPELGDHLVFRLKRRIGRLRTLFNLLWRVSGDKEKDKKGKYIIPRDPKFRDFHQRMAVETLARSAFPKRERQPGETEDKEDESLRHVLAKEDQWNQIKTAKLFDSLKGTEEKTRRIELEKTIRNTLNWKWGEFPNALITQIKTYCEGSDSLDRMLVGVIEFCLPLRGRHWRWSREKQREGERLYMGQDGEDKNHVPKTLGMRGLTMKRLEQILNLRQRCQSFAKLEDRFHSQFLKDNFNPPDSVPRDAVADVCPLLLEKSNRLREQRVYQAAHLILAEALGMKLKNPVDVNDKQTRKSEVDLHGEYERRKDKDGNPYPRCSVIVLENLERYKTSQERTRTENSRLMKWAHRAIVEKLEDMCKPFGITIMLVNPAFSSRFDSRTGLPGVRVNSVSPGFEKQYPYNKWINDKTKKRDETQLAKDIKSLVKLFDESNSPYKGTLLLAVEGGKEFLSVIGNNNDVPNADINAAVNIGLRAVADPQRWDIFPRLRTKYISDKETAVTDWRGWFGKFGREADERRLRSLATVDAATEQNQNAEKQTMAADTGKKSKIKSKISVRPESAAGSMAEIQSSQSSEYPPFFVEHPECDWLGEKDWLKSKALFFEQGEKRLRAYPQGAFLKRVEQMCGDRIARINADRIAGKKTVLKTESQVSDDL
jgi:IS605 OrfB family transposase